MIETVIIIIAVITLAILVIMNISFAYEHIWLFLFWANLPNAPMLLIISWWVTSLMSQLFSPSLLFLIKCFFFFLSFLKKNSILFVQCRNSQQNSVTVVHIIPSFPSSTCLPLKSGFGTRFYLQVSFPAFNKIKIRTEMKFLLSCEIWFCPICLFPHLYCDSFVPTSSIQIVLEFSIEHRYLISAMKTQMKHCDTHLCRSSLF